MSIAVVEPASFCEIFGIVFRLLQHHRHFSEVP